MYMYIDIYTQICVKAIPERVEVMKHLFKLRKGNIYIFALSFQDLIEKSET